MPQSLASLHFLLVYLFAAIILSSQSVAATLEVNVVAAFISHDASKVIYTNAPSNLIHRHQCSPSIVRRISLKMSPTVFDSNEIKKCWNLPRLYVGAHSETTLTTGSSITLSQEQTHYLTKVMRLLKKKRQKIQDESNNMTVDRDCIRIFNGRDGEWLAKVNVLEQTGDESSGGSKNKRRRRQSRQGDITLVAECIHQLRMQDKDKDASRPWLLFAPLKKQTRMKLLMEKCTELGVGSIVPVASDRTEGSAFMSLVGSSHSEVDALYGTKRSSADDDASFEKLELQAIEASEQCERLDIPSISKDVGLPSPDNSIVNTLWKVQDVVRQWGRSWEKHKRVLLICRERCSEADVTNGKASVIPLLQALQTNRQVALLVGPEGGWSVEEEALFDEVCSHQYNNEGDAPVKCISLGSSVLRAETASILAIGACALVHDE